MVKVTIDSNEKQNFNSPSFRKFLPSLDEITKKNITSITISNYCIPGSWINIKALKLILKVPGTFVKLERSSKKTSQTK